MHLRDFFFFFLRWHCSSQVRCRVLVPDLGEKPKGTALG